MKRRAMFAALTTALVLCVSDPLAKAQDVQTNLVTIDASAAAEPPRSTAAAMGSARNPAGEVIGVNSQYLTMNGKAWLPVMGEFHFSRYPEDRWEEEILKMKAAGVQIISTYVIWIHHEETEGVFDWQGQRDFRRFVGLCAKHGMYVYPRIGPWAHAEVRNGGLPDWVLQKSAVRQNDPVFLREVQTFYSQIAQQLRGLLWKDGGPVIGIQIENEYRDRGPGKGDEYIRTLKRMAVADGLDVPLYTVTGWDGAVIPLDAALPVFGGYPDAPWDGSPEKLPPNEVYAFRFDNRSAGSMGAIGGRGQSPSSAYAGTPFLTAEVGDGIEDTYFRRPVLTADDVAAIPTIMLGSGANLLGYYMFHGGRNPDGGDITLQESQVTGYPTDVPVRSYDFQAPLGEFGQDRQSLRKLKLVNYFLDDFGSLLAPMTPRAPAKTSADPSDVTTPRVSARVLGNSAFIFFNNYVRGLQMPARVGFQVQLKLPSGLVRVPAKPVVLPSGSYGMWPVNLQLPGTMLRYGTAQLFKRVQTHDQAYYFFFAIKGVRPEFAFDPGTKVLCEAGSIDMAQEDAALRVRLSSDRTTEVSLPSGVHLVVLSEADAAQVWRVDDPSLLLATAADAFSDGDRWTLQQDGQRQFHLGIFGSSAMPKSTPPVESEKGSDLFHWYKDSVPEVSLVPLVTELRPAGPRAPSKFGASFSWRPNPSPFAPDDKDFEQAAVWKIKLPPIPKSPNLADVYLSIDWQGDVARLYHGSKIVDDQFWNGLPWTVGLLDIREGAKELGESFALEVLPLSANHGMYIEDAAKLKFDQQGYADSVNHVRLVSRYQLSVQAP